MSLPKISQPIFRLKMPSTGNEVQFRPFTVKEEKILLVAEMSTDAEDLVLAVKQILNNCIVSDINVDELAIFDLEKIFIQIRSKSVGNIVPFTILDAEDDKIHEVEVDLDEIEVTKNPEHTNEIALDDSVIMRLKYPTVTSLKELLDFDRNDPEQVSRMVARHIDIVYDDEKVFDLKEESEDSIVAWIDTFGRNAMVQIEKFWETMPTLKHTIRYKNSKGNDRELVLEGLRAFFL